MTRRAQHKFKVGDKVIVTGDTAQWRHGFPENAQGTVLELRDYETQKCRLGYRVLANDRVQDEWNVAEWDVKYAIEPVTEAEIAEVYKILGVET